MDNTLPTAAPTSTQNSAQSEVETVVLPTEDINSADVAVKPIEPVKSSFSKNQKIFIGVLLGLAVILIIAGIIGIYTYAVANKLIGQARAAQTTGQEAYLAFKEQNLPVSQEKVTQLVGQVDEIEKTYGQLGFYKFIPVANLYYADGQHAINAGQAGLQAGVKTVAAIAPYADLLGLNGEDKFEGGSAENRIKLILDTLQKVTPILDEVAVDLESAKSELAKIDERRYPQTIQGKPVRATISQGKALLNGAETALNQYRPIIEQLPTIAGADGKRRKYLVLFQNDNELRPTGGFLTAYAVIFVENGVVTPEKSDDIYELDKKFTKKIAIPEKLGRFLTTEKNFHLRDMNTSPDFKESMDQFYENYKTLKGEPTDIDGIIAVDTHVLTNLLKAVGPVQVANYGTFTNEIEPRCDCPQIIYALSEIITRPTPYIREDRKGILAPLMQGILQKVYASPRVFLADLFTVAQESIDGRHMQAYFFNEAHQQAAEAVNVAGRLPEPQENKDFLGIVNANLGGAKSNLFIDYEVVQTVTPPENGMITKTVEITYKNNRKGDNCNLEAGLLCLNSTLRDWTRIYVPKGAVISQAQGFLENPESYEENGYQVFDSYFTLEPLAQAKIKITYQVPYNDTQAYKARIWKQGGISPFKLISDVNGSEEESLINKDTELNIAW